MRKKKVKDLEYLIFVKDRDIEKLTERIRLLERKFLDIQQDLDKMPEDCKPGRYCEACAFHITYGMRIGGVNEVIHICNRHGCPNFVQIQEGKV